MTFVSLLHATYRSGARAIDVRNTWLERADRPADVEHIFGLDDDDLISVEATAGYRRVVSPGLSGRVTAVRNWNAAALSATGELLFVIADDLLPPASWDSQLRELVSAVDPACHAFAIKLSDGADPNEVWLRHPIVTRKFYTLYGLFSSEFAGLYCDNDITLRAFWKAAILDGRNIRLEHLHPTMDAGVAPSSSQRRMATEQEFEAGLRVFERRWSRWRRAVRCSAVPARAGMAVRLAGRQPARAGRILRAMEILRLVARTACRTRHHSVPWVARKSSPRRK